MYMKAAGVVGICSGLAARDRRVGGAEIDHGHVALARQTVGLEALVEFIVTGSARH